MQPTKGTLKNTPNAFAGKNLHVEQSNTGARPRMQATAAGRRKNKALPPGHSDSGPLELHTGEQENRNERFLWDPVARRYLCITPEVRRYLCITPEPGRNFCITPEAPEVSGKKRASRIRPSKEEPIFKSKINHAYLRHLYKLADEMNKDKTTWTLLASIKRKVAKMLIDLKMQKERDEKMRREYIKRNIINQSPPPKGMYYQTYNRMRPSLTTTDNLPPKHKVKTKTRKHKKKEIFKDSRSVNKSNLPSQGSPQTKIKASCQHKISIFSTWDGPSSSKAANKCCTKLNRNPAPPLRGPNLPLQGKLRTKIKASRPGKNSDIFSRWGGSSTSKAAKKNNTKLKRNPLLPLRRPNLPSQDSPQTKIKASRREKNSTISTRWDGPSTSKAANECCTKLNRNPTLPLRGPNPPYQGSPQTKIKASSPGKNLNVFTRQDGPSTSKAANKCCTELNRNPAPPLRRPNLPSQGLPQTKIKASGLRKKTDIFSRWDGPNTSKAANEYYTKLNENPEPPLRETKAPSYISDFFSVNELQEWELLTASKLSRFNALKGNSALVDLCHLYLNAEKPFDKKSPDDSTSSLKSGCHLRKRSPQKSSDNSSPKGCKLSNSLSDGDGSKSSLMPMGYSYSLGGSRAGTICPPPYKPEKLTLPENNRLSQNQNPLRPVPKTLDMNENDMQRIPITCTSAQTKPTTGQFMRKTQMPVVATKSGISCFKSPYAAATEFSPTEIKTPWCTLNEKNEHQLHLSPNESFLPVKQGEKILQIARTIPPNKRKTLLSVLSARSYYFVPNIGHECKQTEKKEQRKNLRKIKFIPADRKEKIKAFLLNDDQKPKISEKDREDLTKKLIRHCYGNKFFATFEEINRNADTRNMPTEITLMLAQLERLNACILRYHSAPAQQSRRSKSDTAIAVRKRSVHSLLSKNASEHNLLSAGEGKDLSNENKTERDMTGCEMDAERYAANELSSVDNKFLEKRVSEKFAEVDSVVVLQKLNATTKTGDVSEIDTVTKQQQMTHSPCCESPESSGASEEHTGEIKSIKTVPAETEKIRQGLNDMNMEFSAELQQGVSKTKCVHATQQPLSCECLKVPVKSTNNGQPSGSKTSAPSSPKKTVRQKSMSVGLKKSSSYYDLSSEATWNRLTVPRDESKRRTSSNHSPRKQGKKSSSKKSPPKGKGCHPSKSPKVPRGSGSKNVCRASRSKKSAKTLDPKRAAEDQKASQRPPKQHQNSKKKRNKKVKKRKCENPA